MREIWRDIKGCEGHYQVSSYGRAKSLDRIDSKRKGRMLKQTINGRGYLTISLYLDGDRKTQLVHKLVVEAFLNHIPCGMKVVVDHIDNDKQNNKLENLQLISQRENTSKDRVGGSSKYIGVSFHKQMNKYRAQCWYDNKQKHLGLFNTELEASEAYNDFLKTIELK